MSNYLFYTQAIEGDFAILNPDDSRHCVRTLRQKVFDEIRFTDGNGRCYNGLITESNPKNVVVKITNTVVSSKPAYNLAIAIAIPKNLDRLEWFVEKAVEMGVMAIYPMITERTEKKSIRWERLQKIAISALKQSNRYFLPEISELDTFDNLLEIATPKAIAYCGNNDMMHFQEFASAHKNALVLIGPEGDFSENEISRAISQQAIPVTFNEGILRTETAGIFVCAAYRLLHV